MLSNRDRRALLDRTKRTDRLELNSPLAPFDGAATEIIKHQEQGPQEDQVDEWIRLSQASPATGPVDPMDVGDGVPTARVSLGLTGLRKMPRERHPPIRYGQE